MRAALVRYVGLSCRLALATVVLLLLFGSSGCATRLPSAPAAAPITSLLPDVAADVWASRGQIVHQEPYTDPPLAERDSVLGGAWRAVYTSVSGIDGGLREVTGAFFIPRGTPPENGWPVISVAHGTTGIGHDCGPSRQPDLQGYGFMVQGLLASKYAVALTDYEGLGETGSHPYLEPKTAAFNTIDAARALRNITANVSARWMAVGYSQGGQAVWAANELNPYYGNDLQLQGSVALAPATNMSGATELVWSGSMTEEQRKNYPLVILGLARYNPDMDEKSFLHETTETYRTQLARCAPRRPRTDTAPDVPIRWEAVVDRLRESHDLKPRTYHDLDPLRDALRRIALPQRPLDKPMLVISGDRDATVLTEWVQSAVARSCELGAQIEYLQMADANHKDLLWKAARPADRWIAERFAGLPAPSNCPEQG